MTAEQAEVAAALAEAASAGHRLGEAFRGGDREQIAQARAEAARCHKRMLAIKRRLLRRNES